MASRAAASSTHRLSPASRIVVSTEPIPGMGRGGPSGKGVALGNTETCSVEMPNSRATPST
ncbi:hypothetical protein [Archangium violaceum]|uniref:Uncharacterized protein n=1 Tax=Archangium violaceum Cb vi76 TaxID=1406225 RepID=A0A084T1R0_9BACT|nr:hypothetical protein [Archangium violaceum]KFA94645.1 hypothetical protein Q664_01710 [Archangium violaceum Cb vi76]